MNKVIREQLISAGNGPKEDSVAKKFKYKIGDKVRVIMMSGGWKNALVTQLDTSCTDATDQAFYVTLYDSAQGAWAGEGDLKRGWK